MTSSVTETFPLPPPPLIPCVTSFPRGLRVGTPRASNKITVPARTCLCRHSSPSTRLRVFHFVFVRRCGFVSLMPALSCALSCGPVALLHRPSVPAVSFLIGVASCRSCPPYRVRRPVAPWLYYLVPPYRPSRFCSSVWLRFAPTRLIASVVLWPRGLPTLSLRTDRLVFVRRCGFVSLLPA